MCQISKYGKVVYARVTQSSKYGSVRLKTEAFNKPFFLTTMASQRSKYLNERLCIIINVNQQKQSSLKT